MAMTDEEMSKLVNGLVKDCESYRGQLSKDRQTATEYYDGVMKDVEAPVGRSQVISRDVRTTIKKVLPSIIRTILGSDKIVEYQPVGPGDEAGAEQSTDYINNIVFPESNGYKAVKDAVNDALKLRNGVIRWWYDKKIVISVSKHTGLSEDAVVQLVSGDDVTVIEQSQTVEMIDTPEGPQPQTMYDVKIRRRKEQGCTRLGAVPPEEFLIHPDAIDIDESPITGINKRLRRSDLVALGYDRAVIDAIPAATESNSDKDAEESTRRRYVEAESDTNATAMQEVEYYELYVRIDADDDGIAELRRQVYAGGIKAKYLLEDEECDEVPFADIVSEDRPHEREGTSITDDTKDLQKIKTVLLRQTLDNLYWQNMQQPIVQEGTIENPESVLNPKFGQPIRVSNGTSVADAVGFNTVPFVAQQSFGMLTYLDNEITDRTGISDASSGMAADALQNVTAKASAMIEQAGIGQTELMVSTIANGLKKVFKGLLRLTIKHQDKPRVVRLRDEWVEVDPRYWNAEMDATVNTGLGAGTRERDMIVTQVVIALQKELLAAFGPIDNPYVSPDNLYNSISKHVEASGLKSTDLYFSKPNIEEIKAKMAEKANQPDPAAEKAKAEIALDQQKIEADAANDKRKMEIDREIELEKINSSTRLKKYQIDQEIALQTRQNTAEMMLGGPRMPAVHIGGQPG
jgi:hypothetical protein